MVRIFLVISDCLGRILFAVHFVKRYVEDLILALPLNNFDFTLTVFNSDNFPIEFTVESENTHTKHK